jgi:competence protein ComEA
MMIFRSERAFSDMTTRHYITESAKNMMKLFLLLITLFAFTGAAFAAVNINTASQAELESLQGIGPAKAKAIIEYRKKKGSFKSVDDLQGVSGIGPATVQKLRKDITVGGSSGGAADRKEQKPAAR